MQNHSNEVNKQTIPSMTLTPRWYRRMSHDTPSTWCGLSAAWIPYSEGSMRASSAAAARDSPSYTHFAAVISLCLYSMVSAKTVEGDYGGGGGFKFRESNYDRALIYMLRESQVARGGCKLQPGISLFLFFSLIKLGSL